MNIILQFSDKHGYLKLKAVRVVHVPVTNTSVSDVEVLKDPDFEITSQARPGGHHRRDKFVPTHVSDDSVVRVTWKKLYNQKTGFPYVNAMWIHRRIKELQETGWQVTLA